MRLPPPGPDRLALLLGLVGLGLIACLLPFWARMLVSPAPQEMREGAMLLTTAAFLEGRNPYALDTLPIPANVYGPLYPLLTLPLAALLGPGLFVHRLVDGIGMGIACLILYRVLRREGVGRLHATLGAAINLAGLLYWVGPASRPDGVGMALLLGAFAVLAQGPREPRRFAVALLLSLLGLATKVYFVFPVLVGTAFTLVDAVLRRDLRGAILGVVQGIAAVGSILAAVVLLALLFPGWAPVVLGANLAATEFRLDHLLRQSGDWAVFSAPLLLALVLGRHHWREPPDFWAFALFAGITAIVLALGGHPGAHMTYLFHLVSPPLTVVALRAASRHAGGRLGFAALVPATALVIALVPSSNSLGQPLFMLELDRFARAEASFARAQAAIAQARNPTGTTEFAPLLLAAGHTPIETGHSEYWTALDPPWPLSLLWPDPARLAAAEARLGSEFRAAIEAREFDLVLANRRGFGLIPAALLEAHYEQVEPIAIDLPWAMQAWPGDVWRPRASGAQ